MAVMPMAAAHRAAMPAVMATLYEVGGPLVLKKLERRRRGRGLGAVIAAPQLKAAAGNC